VPFKKQLWALPLLLLLFPLLPPLLFCNLIGEMSGVFRGVRRQHSFFSLERMPCRAAAIRWRGLR
jgi:hypothetical protein